MEEITMPITFASSIGSVCKSGNLHTKSEFKRTKHAFEDVWGKKLIKTTERIIVGPFNQLLFGFVETVKTYVKKELFAWKNKIKKLFKRAKRKTETVILFTQLSFNF